MLETKSSFGLWFRLAAILAALLGSVSCYRESPRSLHALYTRNDLILDDRILGKWIDKDLMRYSVEKSADPQDRGYIVTTERTNHDLLLSAIHLIRLGDHVFMDISPASMTKEDEATVRTNHIKQPYPGLAAHMFAEIEIDAKVSAMRMIDPDEPSRPCGKSGAGLDCVLHPSGQIELIVSPTLKLQEFALQHAEDKGLFTTIYLCRQELDCYLEFVERAVRDDPSDVESWYRLAAAYMERDRFDDAWRTWKHGFAVQSSTAGGDHLNTFELAEAFIAFGHPNEGISVLKSMAGRYPQAGESWLSLGLGYCYLDQVKEARAAFKKYDELEPGKAREYLAYGDVLVGDLENARRQLSQPLDDENASWRQSLLAQLDFLEGNYEAAAASERLDEYMRSLALRHLGKEGAAREVLDNKHCPLSDYLQGRTSDAEYLASIDAPHKGRFRSDSLSRAYFFVAEQHLLAGDSAKAREYYQKSVECHGFDEDEWIVAKTRLRQLRSK